VPTYQYRCTECGEELEAVQKFSDDSLTVCPACQGSLRKVFSPVGIVFKGSGFYRTDSRKGSSADGAKKDADGAKKDKEPAAAKSESGSAEPAKSGANGSSSASGTGGGKKESGAAKPASPAAASPAASSSGS
jgi:putative FmdB family regulatory protein